MTLTIRNEIYLSHLIFISIKLKNNGEHQIKEYQQINSCYSCQSKIEVFSFCSNSKYFEQH